MKAWCPKRTDKDMSWAVDDFLGGEIHVINPSEGIMPKAPIYPLDMAPPFGGDHMEIQRFEAEQEARREEEGARFSALSREGKVAELKAKLAGIEDMIEWEKRHAIKTGNSGGTPSVLMLEFQKQKAELEQQIAEYSSPICQEEISLSPEEESQLLAQFPEAWDSLIGQEPLGECQEVAA